ncbi:MAG TPA: DUF3303 family protein [Candidatus Binatia bacterium]|nr:DUF3303 family protein [Candidatus Binatia bacterium]
MLYMVVERFPGGDTAPVYRRFREHGRLAPDGLRYVASWATEDLVEFEVIPVVTSAQAAAAISARS